MRFQIGISVVTCMAALLSACGSNSDGNTENSVQSPGVIAGLISSRTQAAQPASTTNYLVNPNFSADFPPDWNIAGEQPGWQACTSSHALSRVSVNDTQQQRGTGFYAQLGRGQCLQQGIAITTGDELTFSCDVSPFSTGSWNGLGMSFYDENWSFISEPEAVSPVPDGSTQNLAVTGVAPAGAAFVGVWYYTDTGAAMDNCILSSVDNHPRGLPNRNNFTQTYVAFEADSDSTDYSLFAAGAALFEPLHLLEGPQAEFSSLYDAIITHDSTDLIIQVARANFENVGETLYSDSYPVDGNLWDDSSVEIYLNPGLENTMGYDQNDLLRIYGFPGDSEISVTPTIVHGTNSQSTINDNAECRDILRGTERWSTCELRFNLTELGIDITSHAEIGIDVHYNFDEDGGPRDSKYSACSGSTVTAWEDMSKVSCSVVLRQKM